MQTGLSRKKTHQMFTFFLMILQLSITFHIKCHFSSAMELLDTHCDSASAILLFVPLIDLKKKCNSCNPPHHSYKGGEGFVISEKDALLDIESLRTAHIIAKDFLQCCAGFLSPATFSLYAHQVESCLRVVIAQHPVSLR